MNGRDERRDRRLAEYEALRARRPELFENPPGAAYEILFDRPSQDSVADRAAEVLRQSGIATDHADIGVVYRDPYLIVVRDAVRFRSGRTGPYVRVLGASGSVGAAVLPVHRGRIVLVRHFRHASRTWRWEIPRGFGEPGDDSAETARRELAEELGADVLSLRPLGRISLDGAGDDALFSAEITEPGGLDGEEGVDDLRYVTADELDRMILAGEVVDAHTLAAYLYVRLRGATGGSGGG